MEATTLEPSQTSAEPQQNSAETAHSEGLSENKPSRSAFGTPFSAQNAREMALRSHEKRKLRLEELRKAADAPAQDRADYINARLARVRVQLGKLDKLIEQELDPQKLDRLVSAQSRLSEQWRIFSGIPLPGSRRPGREKPTRASTGTGPVDAE